MKFVLHIYFGNRELSITSENMDELRTLYDSLGQVASAADWQDIEEMNSGNNYRVNRRSICYMEITQDG